MSELDPKAAAQELARLNRLAYSLCGSSTLAEDLTQETFARVLARPRQLKGGGTFNYLARTLRNVLSDHRRAERRRPTLVGDDDLDERPHAATGGDPEVAAAVSEIYAAVSRLPAHQRDAIAAVDIAGMTYAEAAEVLDIPVGTVMSRLFRARARLAAALGD